MKSSLGLILTFLIVFFSCSKKQTEIPVTYFSTMKVDTVDHYFGALSGILEYLPFPIVGDKNLIPL
jgi:hypothetical protein